MLPQVWFILFLCIHKIYLLVANIYSDLWKAYGGIKNLPERYRHYTVNHSKEFVAADGLHTQTIESTWQKFKSRHKSQYETARSLLGSYVSQFVWQKEFGGDNGMYHLWGQIREKFKCT
jgi:hypothetical protein